MDPGPSCLHCSLPVPRSRRGDPRGDFCCFGCRLAHELAKPSEEEESRGSGAPSTLLLRLGLGIFLALNIMAVSWVFYSQEVFGIRATASGSYSALTGLFAYLALFLCTGVLALLGLPLLHDAFRRSRSGGLSLWAILRGGSATPLLVVLGVFSAYGLSVINTLRGAGSLYFDTAAMVLVVVSLGSYLEARAKRRATLATAKGLAPFPEHFLLRTAFGTQEVDLEDLAPGQLVRVLPGDCLAFDGTVVEGLSHLFEASLTGEPRPRAVGPEDSLLAGTLNREGQLWARIQHVGDETVLAETERALLRARLEQPPAQRLADAVAAFFVPAVALLALAVFLRFAWAGDLPTATLRSLSVLLISCPCALGLAAPLATWNALRRAADRGILVDGAATLERAAGLRQIFFDKTGTLTEPHLQLQQLDLAPGLRREEVLGWAAALEAATPHPIARAFLARIEESPAPALAREVRTVPGLGVEGKVHGRLLRLGSDAWRQRLGLEASSDLPDAAAGTTTEVLLMDSQQVLARFYLGEALRPGTTDALQRLQRLGLGLGLLSGDRPAAVEALARRLQLPGQGGLLPEAKVYAVNEARIADSGPVAMVGDGINDGPVLAAADIGIALGSASELARRSGNVRLLADALDRIPLLVEIARDTRRRIRANLAFAFGFNSIGILLAAAGALNPVFAALAMVSSSLIVVRISSRAGSVATDAPSAPAAEPQQAEILTLVPRHSRYPASVETEKDLGTPRKALL